MPIELLGSQLLAKRARLEAAAPGVAALLDAGGDDSLNPKLWVCEDSLAVSAVEDGLLALVADSHWGGAAAEALAQALLPSWERAKAIQGTPRRLVKTLLLAEARLQATRAREDRSETTVLLVHLSPERVCWVNVGDSLLWALGSHAEPRLLNRRDGFFCGNAPLAQTSAWSSGERALAPGESLLLASDGLEPEASGLEPAQAAALLRGHAPGSPAGLAALADAACDPRRGGGRDNLALVWLAPPQPLA